MRSLLIACLCLSSLRAAEPLRSIVFGSCIDQFSHPMLDRAAALPMDLCLLIGDNIYGDRQTGRAAISVMPGMYAELKSSSFFKTVSARCPILATWDDHDMGVNDGGGDYPDKAASQKLFLDWLGVASDSPRRQQEGVYHAEAYGPEGKRVQVIMLDTRYHRSSLAKASPEQQKLGGRYTATTDTSTTMLGSMQWQWLEEQLKRPAELRVIASSIQVLPSVHGGECWANLPHELQRLMDLIAKTQASGVLFISGDRHWSEFSSRPSPAGYMLHDFTSSSLTQKHPRGTPTPNEHRSSDTTWHLPNVGQLELDWAKADPTVTAKVIDEAGTVRLSTELKLSQLQAK